MGSARVLIVDAETETRRALRNILITRGYEVSDARSGEEALEHLRAETPTVILLALTLPGLSGLEPVPRSVPAQRSPSSSCRHAIQKGKRCEHSAPAAGADDDIMKPLGIEELVARIRAVTISETPASVAGAR